MNDGPGPRTPAPDAREALAPDPAHRPGASVRERLTGWTAGRRVRRIAIVVGGTVVAVFLLAVLERIVYSGDVMPAVRVDGLALGGLSEERAFYDLSDVAAHLETEPIFARAGDVELTAEPAAMGLDVDEHATLREAREAGRSRNPLDQFLGAVLRRFRPDRVPLHVTFDRDAVDTVVDAWFDQVADGVENGGLHFEGAQVQVVAPRAGRGIDRDEARRAVLRELRHADRAPISLAVGRVTPRIGRDAVERAAAQARRLLAAPIDIVSDGTVIRLEPAALAGALGTKVSGDELVLTLGAEPLATALGDDLEQLVTPPVDAAFRVEGTRVEVVPAVAGRSPDLDAVAAAILEGRRRIEAPLVDVAPARSTEWARGLGIEEQVSSFTTSYPAGQARVTNIHRGADLLNNSVVEPGAVFSLNDTIGARTEERGFVEAPVYYGEFTEDFGGGVSQLATTTFNAVFFGGYEDVTHKPHSLYFSRYPMGREATVNYPNLDLKFRNNTDAGVLIRAYYSDTSITVTFYGDNGGKQVSAEGPNILAERPPEREYTDDPTLPRGEEERVESGYTGYDVEVYRIIEQPGHDTVRERFFWRYKMVPEQWVRGTMKPTTTTSSTTPGASPSSTTGPSTTTT